MKFTVCPPTHYGLTPVAFFYIAAMSLTVVSVRADFDPRYAWFDLPDLSDEVQSSGVSDVNARGEAVGTSNWGSGLYDDGAVYWDRLGNLTLLEGLGGTPWGASDITDDGSLTAGSAIYPGGNPLEPRAVVWQNGVITDIGTLGGGVAIPQAMNNLGQVVGDSSFDVLDNDRAAFIWEDGVMEALPTLGDPRGGADGINDLGDVVGTLVDELLETRAVLWRGGTEIEILGDLISPEGMDSFPAAINNNGWIVGSAYTSDRQWHAVIWVDGQIYDIHKLGISSSSRAWAINNQNVVIGTVGPALNYRAFVWSQGTPMVLLDDLVPPKLRLPRNVADARSINDGGVIACAAREEGNPWDYWAVLLSPVRPTMTVSQPTPGLAGEVNSLSITGITPGQRVHFLYSRNGGGTRIPGCDLQENALMLDSPKLAGSVVADANGEGVFTFFVPDVARNLGDILIQAVVPGECAVSNLVVEGFE